jgi:hypothetical protein
MKPVAAIVACCLALTLSACGGNDDTADDPAAVPTTGLPTLSQTPSATPSNLLPQLPGCDEVWVGDQKLPVRYLGCDVGGKPVRAKATHCESGQKIVTYDGRFYAVPGRPINDVGDLETSADYQAALASCLG